MKMDEMMAESLKRTIVEMGTALVGFADLKSLPEELTGGFPRAIAIARCHEPRIIKEIGEGPTPEYADAYERLNAELNSLSVRISAFIEGLGYAAKPLPATRGGSKRLAGLVEFEQLEDSVVKLPHKTIATLAGLGWIGKTDLLINEKYGPRIRLASVLTDMPLMTDEPIVESRCGKCTACAEACPVQAGRVNSWLQGAGEAERYNVRLCDEFTRKISEERGLNHQLCGICIAACPVGMKKA
jgi:epoxyqueuosine reductase QueG